MFGLGATEIVVVVLVVALLFGARRLPELGKGLGEGMRGFRDAFRGRPSDDNVRPKEIEHPVDPS